MKCSNCEEEIENICDQCREELQSPVICYECGDYHFCSQKCLIDFLFADGILISADVVDDEEI